MHRQLEIGQRVYLKTLVRRKKTDPRYLGPYLVKEILGRHRLHLKIIAGTRSRYLIIHINEIRVRSRLNLLLRETIISKKFLVVLLNNFVKEVKF